MDVLYIKEDYDLIIKNFANDTEEKFDKFKRGNYESGTFKMSTNHDIVMDGTGRDKFCLSTRESMETNLQQTDQDASVCMLDGCNAYCWK